MKKLITLVALMFVTSGLVAGYEYCVVKEDVLAKGGGWYKEYSCNVEFPKHNIQADKMLNAMAAVDWELVSVVSKSELKRGPVERNISVEYYYFKRSK